MFREFIFSKTEENCMVLQEKKVILVSNLESFCFYSFYYSFSDDSYGYKSWFFVLIYLKNIHNTLLIILSTLKFKQFTCSSYEWKIGMWFICTYAVKNQMNAILHSGNSLKAQTKEFWVSGKCSFIIYQKYRVWVLSMKSLLLGSALHPPPPSLASMWYFTVRIWI